MNELLLNTVMAVPGVAEGILGRYCIARGVILILARSAKAGGNCQMVLNMLAPQCGAEIDADDTVIVVAKEK